ncbi:hypothetical protein FOPG_18626 [Fusarium oxysporum f. sp. conglutinans race 2 54008]|uniref:Uncharacterized protein n=1 Tax=Fusarium oxysporum f. sp. conglutinans race 2 54008 TaxID=1089457 RepID=X0GNB4_FUSOX|nr:hypothetical protein FOPG_18626 [Fusarium oxysporum f. sp. conglutinans race 2 54008]
MILRIFRFVNRLDEGISYMKTLIQGRRTKDSLLLVAQGVTAAAAVIQPNRAAIALRKSKNKIASERLSPVSSRGKRYQVSCLARRN